MRIMIYEVHISRLGVPLEHWTVDAESSAAAAKACHAQRLADGLDHLGDTYDAVVASRMSDDDAAAAVLTDAVTRWPWLARQLVGGLPA